MKNSRPLPLGSSITRTASFLVSVLAPPGLILDMRFQNASNGLPLREWLLHGTKETEKRQRHIGTGRPC